MASASAANGDEVEWNWDDQDVKQRWQQFSKFGNPTATEMTGKNMDKWLKDAGVLDAKTITTTMTGIAFSKVAGPKRKTLKYEEVKKVLATVAGDRATKSKNSLQEELDAITAKLAALEAPSVNSAAKAQTSGGVFNRLTDTKGYTGSHKERFDETGKGKGKAGREDVIANDGYVGAYKNKGSYDKGHGASGGK